MNAKKILFVGALASMTLLGAGTANASHITGSCAAELNGIESAIDGAVFLSKRAEMDKTNLLAKLDAADAKLDREKFSDAIDKLLAISNKATDMAGARKAKLDDASGINIAVSDALICVGAL